VTKGGWASDWSRLASGRDIDHKELVIMRSDRLILPSALRAALVAAGILASPAGSHSAWAQGWECFAGDSYHRALSPWASQLPRQILWSTPVDLNPQDQGGLIAHYGSPIITDLNVVIVPVKVGADDSFRAEGHNGSDGTLIWRLHSDYVQPPHNWTLPFSLTLANSSVVMPGAGGTLIMRSDPNQPRGKTTRLAFFGIQNYLSHPHAYNASVQIVTPISSDSQGNLFFGFLAQGAPGGLRSGLARIDKDGSGTWISTAAAANDQSMQKVAYNCAPALSSDGTKVYVVVNNVDGFASNGAFGYLVALDSGTLAFEAAVRLKDVAYPHNDALLSDDVTSSPTVGPDGDVYYGVLENPFPVNNARGWLLHFDATLGTSKTPGAFGWDTTASIVPRHLVRSYQGKSRYLILSKYNNYGEFGGDGVNKVAVLDPNTTMVDPVTRANVMNTVLTIVGPTPDPVNGPRAVKEWCINTAVIDTHHNCAIVNSEDGYVYRWDFASNRLTDRLNLSAGISEPYTPTVIGPDGKVYAINNSTLFACGANR
jgi:hypothetical protein